MMRVISTYAETCTVSGVCTQNRADSTSVESLEMCLSAMVIMELKLYCKGLSR